MLVGTLPHVHTHVQMVNESLGAGKGQHGVVREMRPRAEHLHLTVVLNPVAMPFVGTACYVAYGGTH